jgi:hypothetical protein
MTLKRFCAALAWLGTFAAGSRAQRAPRVPRVAYELAQPSAFRLFNGEWDKVHVVEVAQPRRLDARAARCSSGSTLVHPA